MPSQLKYGDGPNYIANWVVFFSRMLKILKLHTLTQLFELASESGWFPVNRTGDLCCKEHITINAFAHYLGIKRPKSYSESRPDIRQGGIAMLCSWRILR